MKYLLLVLLVGCTNIKNTVSETAVGKTLQNETKSEPFHYEVKEVTIYNGKTKFIKFPTDYKNGMYNIICNNKANNKKSYNVSVKEQVANIYISESYFSKATNRKCMLGDNHVFNLTVKSFNYKKEKLNVKKGKIFLSKKDLRRVIGEKKIKANLYKNSSKFYLFTEKFDIPLNSYITSHYGNVRLFNNKKRSQHLGNDFRAAIGVPIPVANRGRVVFVGNLFYSGNVVVVDHGLDIFTLYGHLSKIQTTKGSIINKGDIVGLAGMTGRVSGPHLHWGVKINGNSVDGFSLTRESELQFSQDDEMAK